LLRVRDFSLSRRYQLRVWRTPPPAEDVYFVKFVLCVLQLKLRLTRLFGEHGLRHQVRVRLLLLGSWHERCLREEEKV
jgi:hypothetical protein